MCFLSKSLPRTNLGEFRYYDGCTFKHNVQRGTLIISQVVVNKLLERIGVTSINSVSAYSSIDIGLRKEDDSEVKELFRETADEPLWMASMARLNFLNAV